jgi:Ribonuclease III
LGLKLSRQHKELSFTWNRGSLKQVLADRELASLGDSYVNFAYSLTLSNRKMIPEGTKVKGSILAEALRRAGLREQLPSRMSRHALADAAEALMVYSWLSDCLPLSECVRLLGKADDPIVGFTCVLVAARERITFP